MRLLATVYPLYSPPRIQLCDVARGGRGHNDCDSTNRTDSKGQAWLLHLDPTASQHGVEGQVSASITTYGHALTFAQQQPAWRQCSHQICQPLSLAARTRHSCALPAENATHSPALDEVDPDTPTHALVMKWLNEDLSTRKLAGAQLKFVAKSVLEALQVLHVVGYVHTGESELLRAFGESSTRS